MITPDNSIAKFKTKCHKFCLCHICHFKMKCSVLQNDKLLDKIVHLNDNSIVKLVYMEHYKDAMDNININWAFLLKAYLKHMGLAMYGNSSVYQMLIRFCQNLNKMSTIFSAKIVTTKFIIQVTLKTFE